MAELWRHKLFLFYFVGFFPWTLQNREMADMDSPLDFELEDSFQRSPISRKKRKKVIGLDDLLTDFYKEKSLVEKEFKRAKASKYYNSDDDDDDNAQTSKEALISQYVDECHQKMEEISGEDDVSSWGIQVFGNQKTPQQVDFSEFGIGISWQSFMENELNSLLELSADKEESFFEGLLENGWLSRLVFTSNHVETSIAKWTFDLMLYSSKEELMTSACDFWCSILSSRNEVDKPMMLFEWLPTFSELKKPLEIYGFLLDSPSTSSNSEILDNAYDRLGPPQNITAWIKFVAACCQAGKSFSIFATSEAEKIAGIIVFLFLDRKLQGLSMILNECMLSVIHFFKDKEWETSCVNVAKHLAFRVPKDLNCLRSVECISGVDTRSKHLRSALSFEILILCLDTKVADAEEVLRLLKSVNVKDKNCDLFKIYIYLALAENWLLYVPLLEEKPLIKEMWGVFLRNCSCQITSTDLRSYASKVRNKASYLLQGTSVHVLPREV